MIIYRVTNMINGKQYIGQTSRTLEKRWIEHCSASSGCVALHNAILKYGRENFKVEQIDIALDQVELDYKEIKYIELYNTLAPNGYNLTKGGDYKKDMRGEHNPMYGKKRPEVGLKNKLTKSKAVNQFSIDGIFIAQYPSIREAERQTGIDNALISACCRRKYGYKTAGGFIWNYE
jgi:hypothetical protein